MEEVFRTIEGLEKYQVSNLGRVISNVGKQSRFLKPQTDAMGYLHCRLYPDEPIFGSYADGRGKKPKLEKVHRLVSLLFIPKPTEEDIWEVNHKDGNKQNNVVTNLEWVTRAGNMLHSWETGLRDNAADKAALKRYKPVKLIRPDGTVEYYQSRKHIVLGTNIPHATLTAKLLNGEAIKKGRLKGCRIESCLELPGGETYKQILNLEQKLLEYKKVQDYFKEKQRQRRVQQRNRKL